MKKQLCPHCSYCFDAVTSVGQSRLRQVRAPKKGDLSLCLNCAAVLCFESADTQRALTPEEQVMLEVSPDWAGVRRAQDVLRDAHRRGMRTEEAKRGIGRVQ